MTISKDDIAGGLFWLFIIAMIICAAIFVQKSDEARIAKSMNEPQVKETYLNLKIGESVTINGTKIFNLGHVNDATNKLITIGLSTEYGMLRLRIEDDETWKLGNASVKISSSWRNVVYINSHEMMQGDSVEINGTTLTYLRQDDVYFWWDNAAYLAYINDNNQIVETELSTWLFGFIGPRKLGNAEIYYDYPFELLVLKYQQ
jgi:hypothetical protein